MQLTFLGTAAAEAYPDAFCGCAHCEQARALGGPSLRKRSAALVNDDLLIDFGPDVMTAAVVHNRPLNRLCYGLQTHAHADHLDVLSFWARCPEYGVPNAPRLHYYASPASLKHAAYLLAYDFPNSNFLDPAESERLNMALHPVEPLTAFTAGPYRVVAFPANHDPAVQPLLYAIQSNGRTLFYGTDTGPLPEETWQGFHRFGLRFDVVVLDHTYGLAPAAPDHMTAGQFVEQVARMRAEGLLAEGARILGTHLAHAGNPVHPEISAYAAQHGYEIAYDGLTV